MDTLGKAFGWDGPGAYAANSGAVFDVALSGNKDWPFVGIGRAKSGPQTEGVRLRWLMKSKPRS